MESRKSKVQGLLKSRKWITAGKIEKVAGGPAEAGVRAARRLREDGFILKTRNNGKQTEYRIAGTV